MRKILAPVGVPGLAASALAIAGPITAHAAGSTGPCSGAGTGNPVQHTGSGHHSFTDSHNNCVNFVGVSDTAFLNDSNFNLINMVGNSDTVHDLHERRQQRLPDLHRRVRHDAAEHRRLQRGVCRRSDHHLLSGTGPRRRAGGPARAAILRACLSATWASTSPTSPPRGRTTTP